MSQFRFPTAAELYALEQQAQRARSVELARLANRGALRVKRTLQSLIAARPAGRGGVRHA